MQGKNEEDTPKKKYIFHGGMIEEVDALQEDDIIPVSDNIVEVNPYDA